jgi:hypothetical protein
MCGKQVDSQGAFMHCAHDTVIGIAVGGGGKQSQVHDAGAASATAVCVVLCCFGHCAVMSVATTAAAAVAAALQRLANRPAWCFTTGQSCSWSSSMFV